MIQKRPSLDEYRYAFDSAECIYWGFGNEVYRSDRNGTRKLVPPHPAEDITPTIDFVKTTTAGKHPAEDSPGAKN